MIDPVKLLQGMLRCETVTPAQGAIYDLLENVLTPLGFVCHRMTFSSKGTQDVENLYARRGTAAPLICFAGHVDVVPPGDAGAWRHAPFSGTLENGEIFGRGAVDMKGGIAAFIAAMSGVIANNPPGSIGLIITGDEEASGINGTKKLMEWLEERGEKIDFCLLGEPTAETMAGDTIKIGRRGSLSGKITVTGVQGHVAYPHLADNPVPKLLKILTALCALHLDDGSERFQPSNLEVTTVDVGNPTGNVIPARATAAFNVRFNDHHTTETLEKTLRAAMDAAGTSYTASFSSSGDSFFTPHGAWLEKTISAIEKTTGVKPKLSTGGGTSDARYIHKHCPVIECGLNGATMHQVDERADVEDLRRLTTIYASILEAAFK